MIGGLRKEDLVNKCLTMACFQLENVLGKYL